MKKNLLVFTTLILLAVPGFASRSIEGTWKFPVSVTTPYSAFESTITFTSKIVTIKNICTLNGHSVEAQVTVPFAYTKASFDILASADSTQSNNGVVCAAIIHSSIYAYSVSKDGSTLSVFVDRDHPLTLTRQKEF